MPGCDKKTPDCIAGLAHSRPVCLQVCVVVVVSVVSVADPRVSPSCFVFCSRRELTVALTVTTTLVADALAPDCFESSSVPWLNAVFASDRLLPVSS